MTAATSTPMTGPAALERLLDMADLLRPAAIRAAATLRLADHVGAGTRDTAGLAARTGADPDVLAKLVRHLVALGLLRRDGSGALELTPLGEPLREDSATSVRGALAMDGVAGHGDVGLVNILHTVRTGEPCHEGLFGRHYWDSLNHEPEFVESLRRFTTEGIGWDAEIILEEYDWSRARHVVDVGGNAGSILGALLRRHPHLSGTLVDLPNTATVAAERFAASALADRARAVPASYFEPLPTGGDVYLLSAILADWDDDRAVTILQRCADAAGPHGAVLLAEVNLPVLADESDPALTGADLYIAGLVRTPVRTPDQLVALAARAGLRPTWTGPTTPVRSLLELRPVAG